MRVGHIVVFHVREQQVTAVALAKYNNVVKAFPADRTDQPYSTFILPRGARRRRSIADTYRSESADIKTSPTAGVSPAAQSADGRDFQRQYDLNRRGANGQ